MHRIGLAQIMLMPVLLTPMAQPLCSVRQQALIEHFSLGSIQIVATYM